MTWLSTNTSRSSTYTSPKSWSNHLGVFGSHTHQLLTQASYVDCLLFN
jgi:hypothetical protein